MMVSFDHSLSNLITNYGRTRSRLSAGIQMRIAVVTVSDTRSAGTNKDLSGPALEKLIKESTKIKTTEVTTRIVPDEQSQIEGVLCELCNSHDVIITTGGTGFAARDVTPEATLSVISRRCTGLEIALHSNSLQATPFAALSRAVAGIAGNTLIVNFPGSQKAVKECWEVLHPLLNHIVEQLCGTDTGALHSKLADGDSAK